MTDETKDGFDARGLCDECQRTREEGHALACICHPHWARTETPVAVDVPTGIQTALHAIRAAQAGEGAAADPAPPVPRDLPTILADWRERIAQARQCTQDSTSTIPNLWQTIYSIDRDELDRVIAAVPAVALPGLADPLHLRSLLIWQRALTDALARGETIVTVPIESLVPIIVAYRGRVADDAERARQAQLDRIRITRMLTYEGPRDKVEDQLRRSLHGSRDNGNGVQITAVTLDVVPERVGAVHAAPPDLAD